MTQISSPITISSHWNRHKTRIITRRSKFGQNIEILDRIQTMSSGVTVSVLSKTVYDEVKKDKKYRYIIYHIKDEKVIDVEVTGSRDATYSDFLAQLQNYKTECRYCVFDFPTNMHGGGASGGAQHKQGMSVDRLVMMTWCPESAKIKQKMLYSSSYDALKKALVGIYKYVQACDFEEVSQEAIEDAFRKGK